MNEDRALFYIVNRSSNASCGRRKIRWFQRTVRVQLPLSPTRYSNLFHIDYMDPHELLAFFVKKTCKPSQFFFCFVFKKWFANEPLKQFNCLSGLIAPPGSLASPAGVIKQIDKIEIAGSIRQRSRGKGQTQLIFN